MDVLKREICTGIYHPDKRYGKRLMEYLNHQKQYPMTVCFFEDEEQLYEKEQEGMFQCLILSESSHYCGEVPAYRIQDENFPSAAQVAKDLYDYMNMQRLEEPMIYGVYSPSSRIETTPLSLEIAKRYEMMYLGMQPYHRFMAQEEETDELLFQIRERKENCAEYFRAHAQLLEGVMGYPGAGCYMDYRQLSIEDFQYFFQEIRKAQILLVIDAGTACLPGPVFFSLFDKVYIPVTEQETKTQAYLNFIKQTNRYGGKSRGKMEEILLRKNRSMKEVAKGL